MPQIVDWILYFRDTDCQFGSGLGAGKNRIYFVNSTWGEETAGGVELEF